MDVTGLKTLKQWRAEHIDQICEESPYAIMMPWTDQDGFSGNLINDRTGIDYGDSMQRTGMEVIAEALHAKRPSLMAPEITRHRIAWGHYVRRPHTDQWYSSLKVTTGDQIRPMIVAMGYTGMRKQVAQIALRLILRAGFYWNTRDTGETRRHTRKFPGWTGPEHWNLFFRALLPKNIFFRIAAYPVLLIGDLVGLFSTINATFIYPKKPWHQDQLNRICTLLQGVTVHPTVLSQLSHYIFRKYRPTWDTYVDANNLRVWRRNDKLNPAQYVLDNYFWQSTAKYIAPPLERLWAPICEKYFRRP